MAACGLTFAICNASAKTNQSISGDIMSSERDPIPAIRNGEFTATPPTPAPAQPTASVGGPLSAEDLIALNEEIAGMARAGLPLDQGLAALAREMGSGRL